MVSQSESGQIHFFDRLSSTNDFLKEHPEYWRQFEVVCAREQTEGRGRGENKWQMQKGRDLAMTMVYLPSAGVAGTAGLTPFIGYHVREALGVFSHASFQVKWPNDILSGGKKVCGILCEQFSENGSDVVLIGIGVNVTSTASENDPRAVSLLELTGNAFSVEALARHLAKTLSSALWDFRMPYSLKFCELWNERAAFINTVVTWRDNAASHRGIMRGIDPQGRMLIETQGELRPLVSAVDFSPAE